MALEKRRARRKPMHYAAWVADNKRMLQGCVVADISETGARLAVETPQNIPDHFMLELTGGRTGAHRTCRVVWRGAREIGVEFDARYRADGRLRQGAKPTAGQPENV